MEKHKSRACNLAKKCKKKEDDYFLVTLELWDVRMCVRTEEIMCFVHQQEWKNIKNDCDKC